MSQTNLKSSDVKSVTPAENKKAKETKKTTPQNEPKPRNSQKMENTTNIAYNNASQTKLKTTAVELTNPGSSQRPSEKKLHINHRQLNITENQYSWSAKKCARSHNVWCTSVRCSSEAGNHGSHGRTERHPPGRWQ